MNITVKTIIDEDFNDYYLPSMFIAMPHCSFKCGEQYCQNSPLSNQPNMIVDNDDIVQRYLNNNLTQAIVFGGLEPMDSAYEVWSIISRLRRHYERMDDVVVYTGYTKEELMRYGNPNYFLEIKKMGNIIYKFGRYVPGQQPHYDEVLGVDLASDNQYAERIS